MENSPFTAVDYLVVVVYLLLVVVAGSGMGRGQSTVSEYFLAGRKMNWPQSQEHLGFSRTVPFPVKNERPSANAQSARAPRARRLEPSWRALAEHSGTFRKRGWE